MSLCSLLLLTFALSFIFDSLNHRPPRTLSTPWQSVLHVDLLHALLFYSLALLTVRIRLTCGNVAFTILEKSLVLPSAPFASTLGHLLNTKIKS